MKKVIGIIFILSLSAVLFNLQRRNFEGVYVAEGGGADSLILLSDGDYLRAFRHQGRMVRNHGKWYYEDKHLTFEDWNNQNGRLRYLDTTGYSTVIFSFQRDLLFKPSKIIYYQDLYFKRP